MPLFSSASFCMSWVLEGLISACALAPGRTWAHLKRKCLHWPLPCGAGACDHWAPVIGGWGRKSACPLLLSFCCLPESQSRQCGGLVPQSFPLLCLEWSLMRTVEMVPRPLPTGCSQPLGRVLVRIASIECTPFWALD